MRVLLGSPYILAVGATLRANSSSERVMRYVVKAAERAGARPISSEYVMYGLIVLDITLRANSHRWLYRGPLQPYLEVPNSKSISQ